MKRINHTQQAISELTEAKTNKTFINNPITNRVTTLLELDSSGRFDTNIS